MVVSLECKMTVQSHIWYHEAQARGKADRLRKATGYRGI